MSKRNPPKRRKTYKRSGSLTTTEKLIAKELVRDMPSEVTPAQTQALAKVLNRTTGAAKDLIRQARETLAGDAARYVDIHREVAEKALESGNPKAWETARKASAWALEHMSAEGQRIVEKTDAGPTGSKVFVGIRIGGIDQPNVTVSEVE